MKYYFLGLFLLLSSPVFARPLKIAVLDSGLPYNHHQLNICDVRDFTDTGVADNLGHGTNVSSLIHVYGGGAHCQLILKVFNTQQDNSIDATISALIYLQDKEVDVVNYSGGGLF